MVTRTNLQPVRRRERIGDLGEADPAARRRREVAQKAALRKKRKRQRELKLMNVFRGLLDRALKGSEAVGPDQATRLREAVSQAASDPDVKIKFKRRRRKR